MKSWIGLLAGAVVFLSGCASQQPAVPAPYYVVISADRNINPDRNGRPAPVQVTLYRLRGVNAFSKADFFTLYEKDSEILGSDLLAKDTFTLLPGESKTIVGKAGEDDRMLGVFVAYRDIENATWRGITTLPEPIRPVKAWYSFSTQQLPEARVSVRLSANKVNVSTDLNNVQVPKTDGVNMKKPSLPTTAPWSV